MGRKTIVPLELIEQCKNEYIKSPKKISLKRIAQTFGVSTQVIGYHSKKGNWLKKRNDYQQRAVERQRQKDMIKKQDQDLQVATRRMRNLTITDEAITSLREKLLNGALKGSIADFDRLMRLQEFLAGNADYRKEIVVIGAPPPDKEILGEDIGYEVLEEGMTDAES